MDVFTVLPAKRSQMRYTLIVSALIFVATTPTLASETWDCRFTAFDGPPSIKSHVTIKINGSALNWLLDPFNIPIPKIHISPRAIRYRILQNNDVGVVAINTQARIDKDIGPIVSSETVAIDKTTGALHAGVVGTRGLHDNLSGHCHVK